MLPETHLLCGALHSTAATHQHCTTPCCPGKLCFVTVSSSRGTPSSYPTQFSHCLQACVLTGLWKHSLPEEERLHSRDRAGFYRWGSALGCSVRDIHPSPCHELCLPWHRAISDNRRDETLVITVVRAPSASLLTAPGCVMHWRNRMASRATWTSFRGETVLHL